MSLAGILETLRDLDGVLELAPAAGSEFPEIAWGDHFFYYAPGGQIPERVQPFATIVTKDYPGDTLSELDPPGRWRLNIHVGRARFTELTGEGPRRATADRTFAAPDVILPHPVYQALGWIAVVNPGDQTTPVVVALLREAHQDARRRSLRRSDGEPPEAERDEAAAGPES